MPLSFNNFVMLLSILVGFFTFLCIFNLFFISDLVILEFYHLFQLAAKATSNFLISYFISALIQLTRSAEK